MRASEATTYVFDRDRELGTEPLGILEREGLIYATVRDGELEQGVEPIGTLSNTACPTDPKLARSSTRRYDPSGSRK